MAEGSPVRVVLVQRPLGSLARGVYEVGQTHHFGGLEDCGDRYTKHKDHGHRPMDRRVIERIELAQMSSRAKCVGRVTHDGKKDESS
jgi:hypothetical protein